ncbi:hypothetical protein [Leptobacterium sp. I13]|uniref:FKBP-type peptidyl-prolyl cis-trans isomerase n=1 Tax=Leptobacterium meishanense TaxID=3128904 RepID=UPI0030EE7110
MKVSKAGFLLLFTLMVFIFSCKKDDDSNEEPEVRDLAEVAIENDEEIIAFLQTHFYNYEAFQNPPANFDFKIVIDTIAGNNEDKIPLIDHVVSKTIVLKDINDNDVPHKLYYLNAREGIGGQPTVADSTFVRYEGLLLDKTRFDSSNIPIWFDLLASIRGFAEGVSEFKAGGIPISNPDGTIDVEGFGVGMVIMPSGLGYFARPPTFIIPLYAPLIFNIQLLAMNDSDHDRDGILSIDEDIDGDGNPTNDDTDGDGVPNYLDTDDDGDGTLTINEYDENNDGIPDDSDSDGIPDYLDNE